MILEQKKLFFHTASVILEDEKIPELIRSNKYSSIVVLSYHKLNLQGFKEYSKPTLRIDLQKNEEEIFASFNDTTRNEIRKTYKISDLTFETISGPTKETYDIYSAFEFSQGRVPVDYGSLAPVTTFVARLNGTIVSGMYIFTAGKYARVRSIFSARTTVSDKNIYTTIGYATRRLIWDICLWGKKHGLHGLDLASVNVDNPKTKSIAQFKMSFGKDLITEYTYIYKSPVFIFFEKFVAIKIFFKKIVNR